MKKIVILRAHSHLSFIKIEKFVLCIKIGSVSLYQCVPSTYLYLLNRLLDRPFDRLVSSNGRPNLPVRPPIYLVYKVGVLAVLITLYNCTHTNQLYPYTTTCASKRTTADRKSTRLNSSHSSVSRMPSSA